LNEKKKQNKKEGGRMPVGLTNELEKYLQESSINVALLQPKDCGSMKACLKHLVRQLMKVHIHSFPSCN
jgi:hypothetical protein